MKILFEDTFLIRHFSPVLCCHHTWSSLTVSLL